MRILLIFGLGLISAGTAGVPIKVTGSAGSSVQIRCPYEAGSEIQRKSLLRGDYPPLFIREAPVQDQRFSLYDDTRSRVFTVTIADLRPDDAGTYWCVVGKIFHNSFKEFRLQVETAYPDRGTVPPPTTRTSAPAGTTPTTTGHYLSNAHPLAEEFCLAN
ncbi:CMRF35-like molecule 3 [Trichomycterus rosablanca]|uniref:CMRF35-like molecule 3 n=1 Tax=Trichomycterus rosablanca TaxID=2290929 RepID=UPI002F35607D